MACAEELGTQKTVTKELLNERCKFGFEYTEENVALILNDFLELEKDSLSWDSKQLERAKKGLPGCDGRMSKKVYDELLTKRIGEPPKKEKKKGGGDKKQPVAAAKPKKKIPKVEKLAQINVEQSDAMIARELIRIANSGADEQHTLGMIADTLAAVRREAYGHGVRSGNVDSRSNVRLPAKFV